MDLTTAVANLSNRIAKRSLFDGWSILNCFVAKAICSVADNMNEIWQKWRRAKPKVNRHRRDHLYPSHKILKFDAQAKHDEH